MLNDYQIRHCLAICGVDPRVTLIQFGKLAPCKDESADSLHGTKNAVSWWQVDSAGVVTRRGRVSTTYGRVMEWDKSHSEYKVLPFFGTHDNPYEEFYRDSRFGPYADFA